jgi:hypothetical protein
MNIDFIFRRRKRRNMKEFCGDASIAAIPAEGDASIAAIPVEGDASVPTQNSTPLPPLRGGGFAGLDGCGSEGLIQVVDQVIDCFKADG